MTHIDVPAGTIVVFGDLACPFTHVAVHRLHTTRARLGLDDRVRLWNRAFPIELLNRAPGTRRGSDSEVSALGAIEPDAGWQFWQAPDYHYPSTLLLAFEAVAAANAQDLHAGEDLDRALRRAFWAESRPIQMFHEILAIAAEVPGVDADRLEDDLRHGIHRSQVFADAEVAATDVVRMSPHLFLPDGTDLTNPGIDVEWHGGWEVGFPVIRADDPTVYVTLLQAAAATGAESEPRVRA